jgi:hypothetical protein
MSYQVTYTTVYAPNAPDWDAWLLTLDSGILSSFSSLEVQSRTPAEIMDSRINDITNPALGFISSTVSKDGDTVTLIETWETEAAYITAQKQIKISAASGSITYTSPGPTVIGSGTAFTSEVSVGDELFIIDNIDGVDVGMSLGALVQSIESDTSLTLNTDPLEYVANDAHNHAFEVRKPQNIANYLAELFSNTYVLSTNITTASI